MELRLPETPPPGLNQQQLKRRYIFDAIVHSECSYISTLYRLVNVSKQSETLKFFAFFKNLS